MIKDDHCILTEVMSPYETSNGYLDEWSAEKKKYDQVIQTELRQAECTTTEVIYPVIGALGTIKETANTNLKKLGVIKQKGTANACDQRHREHTKYPPANKRRHPNKMKKKGSSISHSTRTEWMSDFIILEVDAWYWTGTDEEG